jgi:hypothetical protein
MTNYDSIGYCFNCSLFFFSKMAERRRAWIVKPPNWYCGIGISLIDSISKVYNTKELLKGLSRDLIDFSTWMLKNLYALINQDLRYSHPVSS